MSNDRSNGLISAVRAGHLEKVNEIIDTCGISNVDDGYASVLVATKNKQPEIVKLLLANGCKVNINIENRNNQSDTPLHYAVVNKDINIVVMLLYECADVNARGKCGQTPLHTAVGCIQFPNALIISRGYQRSPRICNRASIKILKLLVKSGANVNAQTINGLTALYAAVEKRCSKAVEVLLRYNADVHNQIGAPLLFMSIQNGTPNITTMLLKKGIDVNLIHNGISALHVACTTSNEVAIKAMMRQLATQASARYGTPIYFSGRGDHNDIIKTLWEFGADINIKDIGGKTALHFASQFGLSQHVANLLEFGSDINIISYDNCTPLDDAMIRNRSATIEVLKQHINKRCAANLYVIKRNLQSARSYLSNEFYCNCKREVGRMIMKTICNENKATFYNIVKKGLRHWTMYAANENIAQVLQSGDYKEQFPIYASMIDNHFRRGVRRLALIEPSTKCFNFLFRRQLPQLVIDELFSYLTDCDLHTLIKAGPYTDS